MTNRREENFFKAKAHNGFNQNKNLAAKTITRRGNSHYSEKKALYRNHNRNAPPAITAATRLIGRKAGRSFSLSFHLIRAQQRYFFANQTA